jgi:hypothetical protein
MTNDFTLDDLRETVEKEFAPVKIRLSENESVVLRNLLRLPKKDREQVFTLMTELEGLDKDDDLGIESMDRTSEIAHQIFVLVADDKVAGKKLVSGIKDDLALTLHLFEKWMGATQPGEARRSPA